MWADEISFLAVSLVYDCVAGECRQLRVRKH